VLAAVTEAVGQIEVLDRDDAPQPAAGEVLLAPEAVGICGSDYHFFLGELSEQAGGSQFPRVLGHEIGARITALGPDCRPELQIGQLVSVWPLINCGHCYPCSIGRINVCVNFKLIGIHLDGGLQQRLLVPQTQVFPIASDNPTVAALVEPLSVAVQAVRRGRVQAGEHAVIFGAGPIGQCIAIAARSLGASVLVIDVQPSRLPLAASLGADTLHFTDAGATIAEARRWAGPYGPPIVFDATGAAGAVHAMIDIVSAAGRAVQVGMSNQEVTLRLGAMTEKELDVIGVSCCDGEIFAEAVALAEREPEALLRLVSHEFSLADSAAAMRFAIDNPTEVMKVVIRDE
jgi:threonine dehydrogenase-like Zn-dependent dehydrogenase